jgi:hypothetical protein
MSIALTLEDELDISRGEMLAAAHQPPAVAANFAADVVWMNAQPLDPAATYLLKHTSQTVKARVTRIRHRVNMQTLETEPAATLELNSIGEVEIETTRPLFLDSYSAHRGTGSFILIDPVSHATVAAGMVRDIVSRNQEERSSQPAAVAVKDSDLLHALETRLLDAGVPAVRTRKLNPEIIQQLLHMGLVVLIESPDLDTDASISRDSSVFTPVAGLPEDHANAIDRILQTLYGGEA